MVESRAASVARRRAKIVSSLQGFRSFRDPWPRAAQSLRPGL